MFSVPCHKIPLCYLRMVLTSEPSLHTASQPRTRTKKEQSCFLRTHVTHLACGTVLLATEHRLVNYVLQFSMDGSLGLNYAQRLYLTVLCVFVYVCVWLNDQEHA